MAWLPPAWRRLRCRVIGERRSRSSGPGAPRRARLRRPSELWGRRTAALGLGLIALAALGAGLMLASDEGDSGQDTTASVSQQAVDDQLDELAAKRLTEVTRNRDAGILVRYPADWKQEQREGVTTLESGDRCLSVSLAATADASEADTLLDETVDGLRDDFKGATVDRGAGQRIGGLTGDGAVLEVKGRGGDPVRVLITVGRGEKFAYLTQVVLRNQSCARPLVESQLVVNSIEYSK